MDNIDKLQKKGVIVNRFQDPSGYRNVLREYAISVIVGVISSVFSVGSIYFLKPLWLGCVLALLVVFVGVLVEERLFKILQKDGINPEKYGKK